eukprot:c9206_g1_i1.p1 GENE.c9206_g1_i1~~c9206_g1_i1.p1  ORF type:complete len:186 (+),score=21.65 c9206_g1_i1:47-604(+)
MLSRIARQGHLSLRRTPMVSVRAFASANHSHGHDSHGHDSHGHDSHGHDVHHADKGPHFGPTFPGVMPATDLYNVPLVPDTEILEHKGAGIQIAEDAELWQDDGRARPEYFVDVGVTPPSQYLPGMLIMFSFLGLLGYASTLVETPYFGPAPVTKRILPHQKDLVEFAGKRPEDREHRILHGQHF